MVATTSDPPGRFPARRLSMDEWELVVHSLREALVAADGSDTILYVNREAERLLGWPAGELVGQPLTVLMPARFRERHTAGFMRLVETGEETVVGRPLRVPARRRDGSEIHVELLVSRARVREVDLFVGLLRDVSERIELEGPGELSDLLVGVLAEASSLLEALPRLVAAMGVSMGWDIARIWLVDDEAGDLRRMATWAREGVFPNAGPVRLPRGDGLPGRVWEAASPLWATTPAALEALATPATVGEAVRTAFGFPIVAGSRVIGVVDLYAHELRDPEQMTAQLDALGRGLGVFIERRSAEDERQVLLDAERRARSEAEESAEREASLRRRLQDAHEELQFQAALLRTQSEAGVEGQLIVSPDGEMISFNRLFEDMWRLPDAVVAARSDREALISAAEAVVDSAGFLARANELRESRMPGFDEILLRDGRVLDRTGAPLFADGTYLGYAWYFRDITDEKRAEANLIEAGDRSAELARTLQRSLLPPELPEVAGVEMAARYHPAGGGIDVGGDFYDVFGTIRGVWGLVIGDVCGKGAEAASMTAFVRYTIRAVALQTRSPAKALARLNDAMLRYVLEGGPDRFTSVAYATLRPSSGSAVLTVACGGHPLPILCRAGGVAALGRPGLLLGVLPELEVFDVQTQLERGDTVVFVTDGVLEARDPSGRELGQDGLAAVIAAHSDATASEMADAVEDAALSHIGGGVEDDIAVLVVRLPT